MGNKQPDNIHLEIALQCVLTAINKRKDEQGINSVLIYRDSSGQRRRWKSGESVPATMTDEKLLTAVRRRKPR